MKQDLRPFGGLVRQINRRQPGRQSGFTLIELMIAIAVAAVLITLATPHFRLLIQNNRLSSAANDFVSALNLARAEAVKRGVVVFICRTDDPQATPPACQRANNALHDGNWSNGWLIYALPQTTLVGLRSPNFDYVDGTDTVVRLGEGPPGDVRITSNDEGNQWNQWLGFNTDGTLLMDPALTPVTSDGASYAVCDDRNESSGRLIRVSVAGRATVGDTTTAADTDCSPT